MKIDRRSLMLASAAGAGVFTAGLGGLWAATREEPIPIPRGDSFPKLPIGMNLAGIADWEPGFPFRNLFLGARPWYTKNLSPAGPDNTDVAASFQYDEDGYPLEVPIRVAGLDDLQTIATLVPNCRPPGIYVLLYDGEGEIEGTAYTQIISSKPGRVKFRMRNEPGKYEGVRINRSKLGNHIRNIRLVAEADENADLKRDPFLPEFLDFCRPFHCLRFMDWAGTNNSIEEHWRNRKRPTFYTMVAMPGDPDARFGPAPTPFEMKFSGGVAIELMVQLCNTLQIDPWFCIPHRATDDYIAQFAKLVHQTLDTKLKVYLEYSNEVWNWGFLQAGWMLNSPLAGALVEAKGGNPWKDEAKTEGKDHPERIGALFRRTFAIWEREWAGADAKRLVRVGAVQAAWFDASQRTIRWCLENGGVDTVSPAAYVGPRDAAYEKWASLGAALTADMVIDDVAATLAELRAGDSLSRTIDFAKRNGLAYIAYEGGQHIQPKGQAELPYGPALAAAQSHPRMYDLYVELMRVHRDLGCSLLAHFNSVGRQGTRWGSWGAKASYDTPNENSPKMRALLDCNVPRPHMPTAE
ncbi:hypothetical protein [Sphingopyxis sp. Geo48]|uniref:hypothetical protein n=1 Tax=Sphingopyxis sp. Geo48 TaxID=545241 RepID=UPI0024B729D5|nr:hypothetical protein [Sphingopyxis sp. Geo48]